MAVQGDELYRKRPPPVVPFCPSSDVSPCSPRRLPRQRPSRGAAQPGPLRRLLAFMAGASLGAGPWPRRNGPLPRLAPAARAAPLRGLRRVRAPHARRLPRRRGAVDRGPAPGRGGGRARCTGRAERACPLAPGTAERGCKQKVVPGPSCANALWRAGASARTSRTRWRRPVPPGRIRPARRGDVDRPAIQQGRAGRGGHHSACKRMVRGRAVGRGACRLPGRAQRPE